MIWPVESDLWEEDENKELKSPGLLSMVVSTTEVTHVLTSVCSESKSYEIID